MAGGAHDCGPVHSRFAATSPPPHRQRLLGAVARRIVEGDVLDGDLIAALGIESDRSRHQVLDAQRMAPAPPAALFMAKVIANFTFVTLVQIVLAPLFTIFYNLHPLGQPWLLLVVMPLGTWALVVNGTFFAALSVRTRNRELLLPLLLFPIFIPALIGMVEAVSARGSPAITFPCGLPTRRCRVALASRVVW